MKAYVMLLLLSFAGIWHNQAQETQDDRKRHFNLSKEGVAISGYDPVSYFSSGGPKKGDKRWTHTHKGVTYLFSNLANKQSFIADPNKYEPAYGGWCAYAMGTSAEKVEVDPLTYKIYNGRLLLFYNKFWVNTLNDWNEDEVSYYSKAESNWPIIINH